MARPRVMNYENAYFGPPTSLVNWCEPDYVHSRYIAETFNTISNLYTVIIGYLLFKHYRAYENRFRMTALLMMMVGIGSAAFHGSLKYHFQLLDELPMLYTTVSMTYIVIEMPYKSVRYPNLPIITVALCCILTIGHIVLKNAELFFACFGILLSPAIWHTLFGKHHRDVVISMRYALFFLIVAFTSWELDRFFCSVVQPYHLHSIWHIFITVSGQYWLNAMVYKRLKLLGIESKLILHGFMIKESKSKIN